MLPLSLDDEEGELSPTLLSDEGRVEKEQDADERKGLKFIELAR